MGYDIYNRGNLEHKQWIGLTYDYAMMIENLTQTDCLVCLTEFELAWLQANVQYMRWSTRWTNCPCTPQELNDMADVLERKLMSCIEINPYQTDYIYNQSVLSELAGFNADYTGVPSSVNPNTPDDFFSGNGSTDRINALCDACKVYVYSYSSNWLQKARVILGAVFVVATVASITLLGGVIAGTVLAGLALITQVALTAMEDDTALDDIVCCMFDAMTGAVINQANFEASLDACGFTVGSNQAIARDIIASDLTVFDNYLSFLNALGDQFILAQAGVSDCPCDAPWISVLDLTLSDYGFTFLLDDNLDPVGEWIVGVGFKPLPVFLQSQNRNQVQGSWFFNETTLESWTVVGNFTKGTVVGGNTLAWLARGMNNSVVSAGSQFVELYTAFVAGVPTPVNESLAFAGVLADEFEIIFRPSIGAVDGDCVVTSVTLTGSGLKPPQLP